MPVTQFVAATTVIWRASIGIRRAHLNDMLIHVIAVRMMQMAIMQIVQVVGVTNSRVTTAGAMLVVVIRVLRQSASAHRLRPSQVCWCSVACSTAFSIMFRTWLSATE